MATLHDRMGTDQLAVPANYQCHNVIISHRWTQFDVCIFSQGATLTIFIQILV